MSLIQDTTRSEMRPESRLIPPSLREAEVIDRTPDPALEELVRLAAVLSGADYAYLAWMDSDRLWFKSTYGFMARDQDRNSSACHWVVSQAEPLLIRDAVKESYADPRIPVEGIELENALRCQSYLGVPLLASGSRVIGTLAVLAIEPNRFSQEQIGRASCRERV